MYGVLPFIRNYFWPSAVRGRRTNGVTHSTTIRLMTNPRKRGRSGLSISSSRLNQPDAAAAAGAEDNGRSRVCHLFWRIPVVERSEDASGNRSDAFFTALSCFLGASCLDQRRGTLRGAAQMILPPSTLKVWDVELWMISRTSPQGFCKKKTAQEGGCQ